MRQVIRLTERDLHRLIYNTVNKILNEGAMDRLEKSSQMHTVMIDGVPTKLTDKQFKKYIKDKKAQQTETNTQQRRDVTLKTGDELDPNQIHAKIDKLIKSAAPLKSLFTFKHHSQRSYGNIALEIMKPFEEEYRMFSIAYRKIDQSIKKIQEYGKKDEYGTYEEARKLSYNIEDMQVALINLCDAVRAKRNQIKQAFGNTPVYNGRPNKDNPNNNRELGFADQLFSKSPKIIDKAITNLYNAAQEIVKIADKGRNPLSYKIK